MSPFGWTFVCAAWLALVPCVVVTGKWLEARRDAKRAKIWLRFD